MAIREFSELPHYDVSGEAATLLPIEYCLEHLAVVLGDVPDGPSDALTVGMVTPRNEQLLGDLRERLGRGVEPVQLNAYEVRKALARGHGVPTGERGISIRLSSQMRIRFDPELTAPQLVNDLLAAAIQRRATDVHIEVYHDDVDMRFRIDGFLRQVTTPLSPENVARVVSRLKVLCTLDPLERQRAQDGHFSALYEDGAARRRIDFRLSTIPGVYGVEAVIRVLDPECFRLELDELGMSPEVRTAYERLVHHPNGLILAAGPTVSGKTNTLYATIKRRRAGDVKIVSVEDPIEYEFIKINQKNVSHEMGFADYTRAFLRQNPDVLLVGEIRDAETAEVVVQAATTGHLVLSSLHTRDALSAVTRLRALGVDDDYIANTLIGVVGQRLVARLCPACRTEHDPAPELVAAFYAEPPDHPFFRGAGCEECADTGYRGLVGLFELLEVDEELGAAIARREPVDGLRGRAARKGYEPLIHDALRKLADGVTSLEEVHRRVTPGVSRGEAAPASE